MAIATFKDLCIDVNDLEAESAFWAATLGRDLLRDTDGDIRLAGPTAGHTVWPCVVPEPKLVKNRVHLDVWAPSLEPFAALTRVSAPGQFPWTTFQDPAGQEFCVFVRPDAPSELKCIEVDATDGGTMSRWWADVLGGRLTHDTEHDCHSLEDVPGCPGEGLDFCPVPEPKTVKNRVHWDITLEAGSSVDDLAAVGARVLREPDGEIGWTVMADPEGNEFCVFAPA